MTALQFHALTKEDLNYLYQWFQEPVIQQWYGREQHFSKENICKKYLPRILGQENVPSFIVYQNGLPLGFIQYYCVGENLPKASSPEEPLTRANPLFKHYNPMEIAGIDCFIAHHKNRGRGLGKQLIHEFIQRFLLHFHAIIVDPAIDNLQAIRCYEQCGFHASAYSESPHYLIMIKHKPKLDKIK